MKTVAVIFGGKSTEHDISIITALASIIGPLEATKRYQVEPVYIGKDGRWFWDAKLKDISLYQSGEIDEFMRRAPATHVLFDHGLTLVKSSSFAGRKQYKKIDLVFPAMHGTYGEDGSLMGLLEMAGVPYVGCNVAASAIAMDKLLAKRVAIQAGIATPRFCHFRSTQLERSMPEALRQIAETLTFPLFVKPTHLGSSIGISRVKDQSSLRAALELAAHYDDMVLVEEAVSDLVEVTLPIMGPSDAPVPALLEQPLTHPEDYFDFDSKYIGDGKKMGGKTGKKGGQKGAYNYSKLPAELEQGLYDKAVATGERVYETIGCSGIARVDMLVDTKEQIVYFNEINPLPGSLYAHNWLRVGVSAIDLVEKLMHYAEESFSAKQHATTSFSSSFLQQF